MVLDLIIGNPGSHTVVADTIDTVEVNTGDQILTFKLETEASLEHQNHGDHDTLMLTKGTWTKYPQWEYNPVTERNDFVYD